MLRLVLGVGLIASAGAQGVCTPSNDGGASLIGGTRSSLHLGAGFDLRMDTVYGQTFASIGSFHEERDLRRVCIVCSMHREAWAGMAPSAVLSTVGRRSDALLTGIDGASKFAAICSPSVRSASQLSDAFLPSPGLASGLGLREGTCARNATTPIESAILARCMALIADPADAESDEDHCSNPPTVFATAVAELSYSRPSLPVHAFFTDGVQIRIPQCAVTSIAASTVRVTVQTKPAPITCKLVRDVTFMPCYALLNFKLKCKVKRNLPWRFMSALDEHPVALVGSRNPYSCSLYSRRPAIVGVTSWPYHGHATGGISSFDSIELLLGAMLADEPKAAAASLAHLAGRYGIDMPLICGVIDGIDCTSKTRRKRVTVTIEASVAIATCPWLPRRPVVVPSYWDPWRRRQHWYNPWGLFGGWHGGWHRSRALLADGTSKPAVAGDGMPEHRRRLAPRHLQAGACDDDTTELGVVVIEPEVTCAMSAQQCRGHRVTSVSLILLLRDGTAFRAELPRSRWAQFNASADSRPAWGTTVAGGPSVAARVTLGDVSRAGLAAACDRPATAPWDAAVLSANVSIPILAAAQEAGAALVLPDSERNDTDAEETAAVLEAAGFDSAAAVEGDAGSGLHWSRVARRTGPTARDFPVAPVALGAAGLAVVAAAVVILARARARPTQYKAEAPRAAAHAALPPIKPLLGSFTGSKAPSDRTLSSRTQLSTTVVRVKGATPTNSLGIGSPVVGGGGDSMDATASQG